MSQRAANRKRVAEQQGRKLAILQAEKLRKQLRKDIKKTLQEEDVRNKYSLPDTVIVQLLPQMSVPKAPPQRRQQL